MFVRLLESSCLLQPMVTKLPEIAQPLLSTTIVATWHYWTCLFDLNFITILSKFHGYELAFIVYSQKLDWPANNTFQVPWIWTFLHRIFSKTWLTCQHINLSTDPPFSTRHTPPPRTFHSNNFERIRSNRPSKPSPPTSLHGPPKKLNILFITRVLHTYAHLHTINNLYNSKVNINLFIFHYDSTS